MLHKIDEISSPETEGTEVIDQIAIIPVDHRLNNRNVGFHEIQKEALHQPPPYTPALVIPVDAEDLDPSAERIPEFPSPYVAQEMTDGSGIAQL
jgi:hypothetical protein